MEQAVKTAKWEYFIDKVNIKAHGPEAVAEMMGPLGDEGWELVTLVYLQGAERLDKATHYVVYKRPTYD